MLPSVTQSHLPACTKAPAQVPSAAKPLAVAVRQEVSQSTTVEISGRSISLTQHRSIGVQAYQAVEPTEQPKQNPFANTILSFIQLQLERDRAAGASPEELQSRLQAGLDGFLSGYGQAYDQLSASGLLGDEVLSEIEDTKARVLAGIKDLADELGVEVDWGAEPPAAPVAQIPAPAQAVPTEIVNPGQQILSSVLRDVQIIEQYQKTVRQMQTYEHLGKSKFAPASASHNSYSYGIKESRDFSLKLRTADGDAVTIRMSSSQAGVSRFDLGGTQLGLYGEQRAGFSFSVEGELDEGELRALTDLLNQIADVSEQFFGGDLDRAFELAGNISYDSSEIAAFDVGLSMARVESASVAQVEQRDLPKHQFPLAAFVAGVGKAGGFAERLGQPRSLVADLLEWLAQSRPWEPRSAFLGPAARAFL